MNNHVLRNRAFWRFLQAIQEEGAEGHGPAVFADWLDEHDSPLRAHLMRHAVPETIATDRVDAYGHAAPDQRQAHFKGDPSPSDLEGIWHGVDAPNDPYALHINGPETYELFHAHHRWAVRYTIRRPGGRVTIVAPVGSEHLRAIGDAWQRAWEAAHPDDPQRPWNHWHQFADQAERSESAQPAGLTRFARITLGPGTANGQPFGGGGPIFEHPIHDESGARIGHVRVQPRGNGSILHVHWVGLDAPSEGDDANALGAEAMRSAVPELRKHYPDAHIVQGLRVSGFRGRPNAQTVAFPLTAEGREALRGIKNKLARSSTQDALINQVRESPNDLTLRKVLADAVDEDAGKETVLGRFLRNYTGVIHVLPTGHLVTKLNGDRVVSISPLAGRYSSWVTSVYEARPRVSDGRLTYRRVAIIPGHRTYGTEVTTRMRNQAEEYAASNNLPFDPSVRHGTPAGEYYDPDQPDAKLARMKAPAQGAVVNNRFAKGGQFIERTRARIRSVAEKLTKLARPKYKTNVPAAIGSTEPARLTLGQLKTIEDEHGLPDAKKLSLKVTQDQPGDEHPFTAKVEHIAKFLNDLTNHQIDSNAFKAMLRDPKKEPGEKLVHLTGQLGAELADANHTDWYGEHMNTLDRLLHKRFAESKNDPLWGKLDSKGELVGKHNPAEHHPAVVLFKALMAATSASQNPIDNLASAIKAWKAGAAQGDPILHAPLFNVPEREQWIAKAKELHGPSVDEAQLRNPGATPEARAAWYTRFVLPFEEQLAKVPGYASAKARILYDNKGGSDHPQHGALLGYEAKGRWNKVPNAPREDRSPLNAKFIDLPLVDPSGGLRPKGWGRYGAQIARQVVKLQRVMNALAQPNDSQAERYRRVARWLLEPHTREQFDEMRKATNNATPESKAIWSEGFLHSDEQAPGSFIFGPKFGPFFLNLHSNDPAAREERGKYLTADKWWTRTFNRYLGQLVTGRKINEAPNRAARDLMRKVVEPVATEHGLTVAELQADLWYYEQHLYQMLGGEGVDSYSYQDAAKQWLDPKSPVRLARPLQIVQPGETAHAALDRLLGVRQTRRHGRTASIDRLSDGSIAVSLHGSRIVTAHPNGQVTLDHHGYRTATTRRFMEGFSGYPVSFAGRRFTVNGEPYENGTLYPPAQEPARGTYTTVPDSNPELASFAGQLRPQDTTTSKVFADWLDEHNDWRAPIFRNAVWPYDSSFSASNPISHETGADESWGVPSYSYIEPDDHRVPIFTRINGSNHVISHLSPDEYEQMRLNAETAGVKLPKLS